MLPINSSLTDWLSAVNDWKPTAISMALSFRSKPCLPCKVCSGTSTSYGSLDFGQSCLPTESIETGIPVDYYRCIECGFIFSPLFDSFTADEWINLVYNADYTRVDPDYLAYRPSRNAEQIAGYLVGRRKSVIGLDFGGGNGLTARLLRTRRWLFDSYDPFGHSDLRNDNRHRYRFCSAFEVFEHSSDPVLTLTDMLALLDPSSFEIMIGTTLHDGALDLPETLQDWWYAAPRNGHISLFSRASMRVLANHFSLELTSISSNIHVLSRNVSKSKIRRSLRVAAILRRIYRRARLFDSIDGP